MKLVSAYGKPSSVVRIVRGTADGEKSMTAQVISGKDDMPEGFQILFVVAEMEVHARQSGSRTLTSVDYCGRMYLSRTCVAVHVLRKEDDSVWRCSLPRLPLLHEASVRGCQASDVHFPHPFCDLHRSFQPQLRHAAISRDRATAEVQLNDGVGKM